MATNRWLRPILAGTVAGAGMFMALNALGLGRQQPLSVQAVRSDPGKFYGQAVLVEGIARSVRQTQRYVGKDRIPVVSLMLYEPGPGTNRYDRIGKYYVSVTIPLSELRTVPNEDDPFIVTGVLQAPSMVGSIEPQ